MHEISPDQDFYPFQYLEKLVPLERMKVNPKKFHLDIAKCPWNFLGIDITFRLYTADDVIEDLPSSITPLGPVTVELEYKNGVCVLKKVPLAMVADFNSDDIEKMKEVQWYDALIIFNRHVYQIDSTNDWDLVFDKPLDLTNREISLGSILVPFGGGSGQIALPYDLDRVKLIKGRMIDKNLPTSN